MDDTKKEILSSHGKISSMRWGFYHSHRVCWFLAIIAVVGNIIIAGWSLYKGVSLETVAPYISAFFLGVAALIGAILGAANVGKSVQSMAEHGKNPFGGNNGDQK
jgi:hypothetical protein